MRVRFFESKIFLAVLVLFQISAFSVCGQNLNLLTPYLGEKDKKTIEDAIEELKKAGELVIEANQYYNEALSIQSDNSINEEERQKKAKSIESKAIDIQLKADKIYKYVNKKIIETCVKSLKDKDVSNEKVSNYIKVAGEQAINGDNKRNEASKIKNVYEKATYLNDASEFESAAIDDYISAIAIINDNTLPDELRDDSELMEGEIKTEIILSLIDTAIDGKSIDEKEKIAVYQQKINKYYDYIYNQNIKDPLMINRSGATGIPDGDLDALAAYFKSYMSGTDMQAVIETFADDKTSLPDPLMIAEGATEGGGQYGETGFSSSSDSQYTSQIADKDNDEQGSTELTQGTGEGLRKKEILKNEYTVTPGDENNVRFTVQIAASRIPLTKTQLWAIYPSNLTIEVVREGSWYKYRITGFRLFSQANRVAIESGVKGAWVLATLNGKEITLAQARETTRGLEEIYIKQGSKSGLNTPDFYIQFAASRTPIPADIVQGLCSEVGKCREVIEEGWYKYQYFGGTSYDNTIQTIKGLSRKTFIVAYRGGTKINLYKALRKEITE